MMETPDQRPGAWFADEPDSTTSPLQPTYAAERVATPTQVLPAESSHRHHKPARGSDWKWFAAAALVSSMFTAGAFLAADNAGEPAATAAPVVVTTTTTTTTQAPAIAPPTTAPPPESPAEDDTLLLDASFVGDTVIPSVVTVQIVGGGGIVGSGSGVVLDSGGHIVTNDHVVAAGNNYEVVLADGRIYPADLVGTDPSTDLAVLLVETADLRPIALGSSDSLTVGDPAVAVGNPLGLDGGPSLTVGVISAFGREVQTDATTRLFGMLQTDAPITQGSSGGALVDKAGRLVGITTAVGVSDVGIEGIGFATPVEVMVRVVNEIIATGSPTNPYLGVNVGTSFADTTDGGSAPVGVVITTVEPDTPAQAAGLQEGDVITSINGVSVKTFDELISQLRRYGAGTIIEVTLVDDAVIEVTLGERPDA